MFELFLKKCLFIFNDLKGRMTSVTVLSHLLGLSLNGPNSLKFHPHLPHQWQRARHLGPAFASQQETGQEVSTPRSHVGILNMAQPSSQHPHRQWSQSGNKTILAWQNKITILCWPPAFWEKFYCS